MVIAVACKRSNVTFDATDVTVLILPRELHERKRGIMLCTARRLKDISHSHVVSAQTESHPLTPPSQSRYPKLPEMVGVVG